MAMLGAEHQNVNMQVTHDIIYTRY